MVSSQDPADHPQKSGRGMFTQICSSDKFSLRLAGIDKCLNIYLLVLKRNFYSSFQKKKILGGSF